MKAFSIRKILGLEGKPLDRSQFAIFSVILWIALFALMSISFKAPFQGDYTLETSSVPAAISLLALLAIAVIGVRLAVLRLRDAHLSPYLALLLFIPYVGAGLFVFLCIKKGKH